jgi:hypothetical protein
MDNGKNRLKGILGQPTADRSQFLRFIVYGSANPHRFSSIVSLYVLNRCVAHLICVSWDSSAVRVSEGKVDQPIQGPCQWVKNFVCTISKRIIMPKKGRRSHASVHDRVGRAPSSRVWVCWIIQGSYADGLIEVSSKATYVCTHTLSYLDLWLGIPLSSARPSHIPSSYSYGIGPSIAVSYPLRRCFVEAIWSRLHHSSIAEPGPQPDGLVSRCWRR